MSYLYHIFTSSPFQFFSFQLVYAHAHIDETKGSIQENNEKQADFFFNMNFK